MTRRFNRTDKLVIASHNSGKVSEIRALLAPLQIEVTGAADLDLARAGGNRQQLYRKCRIKSPPRRAGSQFTRPIG